MIKTYAQKSKQISRQWYLVDASDVSMGRVATAIASLLIGKHKSTISPHIDGGDYVIVLNSDKAVFTGDKQLKKLYRRHSGYPGGLKQRALRELMPSNSHQVIEKAVRGMLPVNKLRKSRLERLKIYPGSEHPHQGQNPKRIDLSVDKG